MRKVHVINWTLMKSRPRLNPAMAMGCVRPWICDVRVPTKEWREWRTNEQNFKTEMYYQSRIQSDGKNISISQCLTQMSFYGNRDDWYKSRSDWHKSHHMHTEMIDTNFTVKVINLIVCKHRWLMQIPQWLIQISQWLVQISLHAHRDANAGAWK